MEDRAQEFFESIRELRETGVKLAFIAMAMGLTDQALRKKMRGPITDDDMETLRRARKKLAERVGAS